MFQGNALPELAWAQAGDLAGKFGAVLGKLSTHGRGEIEHLDALAVQSNLIEQLAGVFDSSSGVEITFQVMTITLQSAGHHDAVGAILKRAEDIQHVELAGAGQLDDFDRGRIFEAHAPREVRGGIRTIVACERDDLRAKVFRHNSLQKLRFGYRLMQLEKKNIRTAQVRERQTL